MLARSAMLRQLLTPSSFAFRSAGVMHFQMAHFSVLSQQERNFAKKFGKARKSEDKTESEEA